MILKMLIWIVNGDNLSINFIEDATKNVSLKDINSETDYIKEKYEKSNIHKDNIEEER